MKRYKKYRQDQIERFIYLKQEGLSIPKAAMQCGIPRSTAYEVINEFNSTDGTVLPGNNLRKSQNKAKKLYPIYSEFLIHLFLGSKFQSLDSINIFDRSVHYL